MLIILLLTSSEVPAGSGFLYVRMILLCVALDCLNIKA